MSERLEVLDVDNLYIGVSVNSAWLLLKCRLANGDNETLFFTSTVAHWLLKELQQNFQIEPQPMPPSPQPDITDEDWAGKDAVAEVQCNQFENGLIMSLVLADGRMIALRFYLPQAALLLHYLRDAAPDLIDLAADTGGNA